MTILLLCNPVVGLTAAKTYCRNTCVHQLQQFIRTFIVWSGCGTYSYCHPLRALVTLGDLKVAALIDSGSDYDAIDVNLAQWQEKLPNPCFICFMCISCLLPLISFKVPLFFLNICLIVILFPLPFLLFPSMSLHFLLYCSICIFGIILII